MLRKRYFLLAFLVLLVWLFFWLFLSYPEMNRRFTYKSRQTEAKVLLAGFLSAQKSYKKGKNEYSANLKDIDFETDFANWYVVGFGEACRKGSEVLNTLDSFHSNKVRPAMYSKMRETFKKLPCDPSFPVYWEAYAVGDASGALPDIWRMNSEGQLVLVQDGLAGPTDP